MDFPRIRRELAGSLRLLWTAELWLYGGAVTVLAGFILWVGATGGALAYGADFAGIELSVIEWSSATTVVFGVVAVLWLLAPAALVSYLLSRRLTNVSGNVHTHYRVQHPSLLVAPFVVLYALGIAVAVGLDEVTPALAGALTVVGLLVLIRTIAYSYRVFSLSVPLLLYAGLFLSLILVAVTILVGAGLVAGRRPFVEAAAAGVGDLLGTGVIEDIVLGSRTVGPVTVPTLPALTAGLPVGIAVLYILVQSASGLVARLRKPDVPRSKLRTGQRYPAFAHPISGQSAGDTTTAGDTTVSDGAGTADSGVDESAVAGAVGNAGAGGEAVEASDSDASGDDAGHETEADDAVSHTRVYTAPDDADFDGTVPGVEDVPDATPADESGGMGPDTELTDEYGETAVADESDETTSADDADGYRCPTCDTQFDPDTNFAYCPTCGTELQPE